MKKLLLTLFLSSLFLLNDSLVAQMVALDSTFGVRHETVFFGAPTNYWGCPDSLFMDLYKPVNGFSNRPIVILLHGGGFVAGGKSAPNLVRLGDSLAARGYVTASIEYRLGHHIQPGLTPSFGCLIFQVLTGVTLDPCSYPADTAEQYRALFRGMQDAKGAIRFLKGRAAVDSTDKNRVFIGGESAGGFISLAAAMIDLESEKRSDAGALADAPLVNGIVTCNSNNPCGSTDRSRPDLGSIRGDLHLNGESDEVVGVLSFAGGLLDAAVMDTNVTHPRVYVFHQECDPVVAAGREKIYWRVNNCVGCSGCPTINRVNRSSGGFDILDRNQGLPVGDQFSVWEDTIQNGNAVSCYFGLWSASLTTCPQPLNTCRYCSNQLYGQCHNLLLTPDRMDSISAFLYEGTPITGLVQAEQQWKVYPNPFQNGFTIEGKDIAEVVLMDVSGRIRETRFVSGLDKLELRATGLAEGIYFVKITDIKGQTWVRKVLKGGK